jgi:hypothetical protein
VQLEEEWVVRLLDATTRAHEAFAELRPPAEAEAGADEIVELYEDTRVAYERAQAAASVGQSPEEEASLAEARELEEQRREVERELGICGRDG